MTTENNTAEDSTTNMTSSPENNQNHDPMEVDSSAPETQVGGEQATTAASAIEEEKDNSTTVTTTDDAAASSSTVAEEQQQEEKEEPHYPDHHPSVSHPAPRYDPDHRFYDPHGYLHISNYNPSNKSKTKLRSMFTKMPNCNPLDIHKNYKKKGLYAKFATPEEATQAKKMLLVAKPHFLIDFKRARKWDPRVQRANEEKQKKRLRATSAEDRDIEDQVTPLAKKSYLEQMKSKQESVLEAMDKHFGQKFYVNWAANNTYDGSVPSYLQPHFERLLEELKKKPKKKYKKHKKDDASETSEDADSIDTPSRTAEYIASLEDLDDSKNFTPEQRKEILNHAVQKSVMLPYKYLPIVSSPQVFNYRNNSEFTCGLNENNEKTVGFLKGQFQEGFVTVSSPSNLKHISLCSIDICERMDYVINQSELKCYNKIDHSGFWRLVKVRNNNAGDCIVMIQVHPDGATEEQINAAKKQIVDGLTSSEWNPQNKFTIKGILFQKFDGVSNAAPEDCPVECLYGEEYIYETVLGKKFRISIKSFFQVNTACAEKLYSIAIQWAMKNCDDALLLDVCCGTGTIGIIMRNSVKKVVGLEINGEAVKDAQQNAELNQVTDVEFVLGKAEETIADVIDKYRAEFQNIVAIVDPPRCGLHKKVLRALYITDAIEWIVYVSCGPGSLASDAAVLCSPPNRRMRDFGEVVPFQPIQQVSVDMFPHTRHCENVMLLRRVKREDFFSPGDAYADVKKHKRKP